MVGSAAGLNAEAVNEHVFEAEGVFFDLVDDLLCDAGEDGVSGQCGDGDDETKGGGIERDGDVFREFFGFFVGGGFFEGLEGVDQTEDGAKQAEHGGDVGDSGEVVGAFLDFGDDLKGGFFDGGSDSFVAFVGAGETCFDHAGKGGSGGGITEFDSAVDVVGHDELLNLCHEGFAVDIVFEE